MDNEMQPQESEKSEEQTEFKKPVLIGRVGKLLKKLKPGTNEKNDLKVTDEKDEPKPSEAPSENSSKNSLPPAVLLKELSTPIPYKEPKWSGLCPDGSDYALEVLKSGVIVEKVDLTNKPYYVFGRLANCDVIMAHPTISRHHSVLQYKAFAEDGEPPSGWYLFDLGSTHGTFLNKERLKAGHYTRVRVGHQIKFGNSTRTYIVLGPDFDCEGETELSVTEIKKRAEQMKLERDRMIQDAIEQRERDRLEEERKREEQGIDWGMGEDAEEEPDLSENPYAATANEELYLNDPKKTLRGYFEREGHELTYDCEERGVGQYICRVELPMDDSRGRPVVAEVIHRGKKKEAVIACALEACRVLDRAGLLRQAKHESRKRKERDWSADDYYDSDDDSFLDRTGAVERKRNQRMAKHGHSQTQGNDKPLTYDDLVNQIKELERNISGEERTLERLRSSNRSAQNTKECGDSLDEYMDSLSHQGQSMSHKAEISKVKMNIQKLKSELAKAHRLADVARPAHLPPLIKRDDKKIAKMENSSVVYGKRLRLKEDGNRKPKVRPQRKQDESEFVEEMDSDEEEPSPNMDQSSAASLKIQESDENVVHDRSVINEDVGDKNDDIDEKSEDSGGKSVVNENNSKVRSDDKNKRVFGPMRPPDNYVIPENYYDQETDRDLPEITEVE